MARKRLAKWYMAANQRRGELIYKRGRTPAEDRELEQLQRQCLEEVERVYPMDFSHLDRLRALAEAAGLLEDQSGERTP